MIRIDRTVLLLATGGVLVSGGLLTWALWPTERRGTPVRPAVSSPVRQTAAETNVVRAARRPSRVQPRLSDANDVAQSERQVRLQKFLAKIRNRKRFAGLKMAVPKDWYADLPESDRKFGAELEKALENDDQETMLKLGASASGNPSAEVRQHAVDALGQCGLDALQQLSGYLNDEDENVAQSAVNSFGSILDECEKTEMKLAAVEAVFMTGRNSQVLDCLSGVFQEVDRKSAAESLVRIIEKGTAAGKSAAGQAYRELTGHGYEGPERLQQWMDENYTPPD